MFTIENNKAKRTMPLVRPGLQGWYFLKWVPQKYPEKVTTVIVVLVTLPTYADLSIEIHVLAPFDYVFAPFQYVLAPFQCVLAPFQYVLAPFQYVLAPFQYVRAPFHYV